MVRLLLLFLLCVSFSLQVQAKEKPQITLKQSAENVWQRQQVLITLEVKTDDAFSRLEVDPFQLNGLTITPFKQQRIENKDHVLLIKKWAVFPFVAGNHKLQLPEIMYRPNGGRKQKLDLKELSLQVRRLPVYVPPTMPVGKISLKSTWNESWLTTPNNLLEWQVHVDGEAVAQQTMPPITRQLVSHKSLQFLPAKSEREMLLLDKGIINQLHYKIPLKASRSGMIDFPEIKVQYFEPVIGKLQTTQLSPPFVLSINKWLLIFIIFVVLLCLIVLLTFIFKAFRKKLKKLKQRKLALQQLKQAKNYQQIRDALNQLSLSYDWESNLSISNFYKQWEIKFGKSHELLNTLEKLQTLQFAKNTSLDFSKISQSLIKNIKY